MSRLQRRLAALPLVLLALLGSPLLANDHPNLARGFDAGKAYELPSDLEAVNLFNGALNLAIPIGQSYPVSGTLSYGLTLRYNSRPWDFFTEFVGGSIGTRERSKPTWLSNSGLGWSLSLGRLLPPLDPDNDSPGWSYIGPDGSPHLFTKANGQPGSTAEFPQYTGDGSLLRLVGPPHNERVEFPDGTVHEFVADPNNGHKRRLSQIRDRSGNTVTVSYQTLSNKRRQWTITDSQGRVHRVEFSVDPLIAGYYWNHGGVLTKVDLAAFGGDRAVYRFTYGTSSIPLSRINYSCPFPIHRSFVLVPLLTRIDLPEGDSYRMSLSDYNLPNDPELLCERQSGQLRGMTLPTLGRLEWDYRQLNLPLPEGDRCKDFLGPTVAIAERRRVNEDGTVAGRWKYAPSIGLQFPVHCSDPKNPNPPRTLIHTVTDPLGHYSKHYFSLSHDAVGGFDPDEYGLPLTHGTTDFDGRHLSTQSFDKVAGLLRSTYVVYEKTTGSAPDSAKPR